MPTATYIAHHERHTIDGQETARNPSGLDQPTTLKRRYSAGDSADVHADFCAERRQITTVCEPNFEFCLIATPKEFSNNNIANDGDDIQNALNLDFEMNVQIDSRRIERVPSASKLCSSFDQDADPEYIDAPLRNTSRRKYNANLGDRLSNSKKYW
eukprot:3483294-Rhodomonas_salina.1